MLYICNLQPFALTAHLDRLTTFNSNLLCLSIKKSVLTGDKLTMFTRIAAVVITDI